ncbi:MAG: ribulose-phosphate 3-epimerase [Flavobacteriaceae bacterium]|nr:ribulose-phosphate 3-epimerase [Flavobacteriaceae bacterium]
MQTIIAPSILAANFANLQKDIEMVNSSSADWFHLDVMDGLFVPNISFGMPIVKSINNLTSKPLDVHLMIVDPERYINKFVDLNASIITVHYEACKNLKETLRKIRFNNIKSGVAINPETPINVIEEFIEEADLICIMSVNPGFGGQKFIENTYNKIEKLNEIIIKNETSTLIEVDGGVSNINAEKLINLGANVLVSGNYIFKAEDPLKNINLLKSF